MDKLFPKPDIPKPPPTTPLPDENDPAVLAAKKREMDLARMRSGRMETILSDDYSRDKLGGR